MHHIFTFTLSGPTIYKIEPQENFALSPPFLSYEISLVFEIKAYIAQLIFSSHFSFLSGIAES